MPDNHITNFTCSKCGNDRPGDLFHSGKRKKSCQVCWAYKDHRLRAPIVLSYYRFEVAFISRKFNREMRDRGFGRCAQCKRVKLLSDSWANASWCMKCNTDRKRKSDRTKEYEAANKKRGNKTYGSREAMLRAKGYYDGSRVRDSKNRQIEFRAGDTGIDEAMQRLAKNNALEALRYHITEMASDEWCDRYYAALGKPWNNPRLSKAEAYRVRYRMDNKFAINERMRRQIRKAKRKDGIGDMMRDALKRGGSSNSVERQLGYSIADLRRHLERQFHDGMCWDAFARGDIHIDHIVPQASFDLSCQDEWRSCWSLSNLRPTWAVDNLKKSAKMEFLL